MGDKTGIEWADATWNPLVGCSVISPGCKHCYAMKVAARMERLGQAAYAGLTMPSKAGPVWTGKVGGNSVKAFEAPLRWKKPRRIFVNSMSDLFHESVTDEAIDRIFAVMALCPQHTFQVLTKRAERMRSYVTQLDTEPHQTTVKRFAAALDGLPIPSEINIPFPNVWLGVSVEDQARALDRVPMLLETPAAKRFLSCEPLLGPVDLSGWLGTNDFTIVPTVRHSYVHWVIAGGESGDDARPMHPDWARSLRDQCQVAEVPFFFKQWGEWVGGGPGYIHWSDCKEIKSWGDERYSGHVGKKAAGRMLDGREWSGFPGAAA